MKWTKTTTMKTSRTMRVEMMGEKGEVSYLTILNEPVPVVDKFDVGGGLGLDIDGGYTFGKGDEMISEVHGRDGPGGRLAFLGLRRLFMLSSASVAFWRSKKVSNAAHSSRSAASIQSSCSGSYGAAHLTSY